MKKLDNYVQALDTLVAACSVVQETHSDIEDKMIKSGFLNQYEKTFELAWKLMKYMLETEGVTKAQTGSPREILCLAYENGYLDDERCWLSMLKLRNQLSHDYDGSMADQALRKIKDLHVDALERFQTFAVSRVQQIQMQELIYDMQSEANRIQEDYFEPDME